MKNSKKQILKGNKYHKKSLKNKVVGGKPYPFAWLWKGSNAAPEIPLTMSFSPAKTFPIIKQFIDLHRHAIEPNHPLLSYATHLFDFENEYKQIIENTYHGLKSQPVYINEIFRTIQVQYSDVLNEHIFKSLASTYIQNQNRIIQEYLSRSVKKQALIGYLLSAQSGVVESRIMKLINAGIDPILLDYATLHKFKFMINKENKIIITCDNEPTRINELTTFIDNVEQGNLDPIITSMTADNYRLLQYMDIDPPKIIEIFKEPCEYLPCYVRIDQNIIFKSYNSKLKPSQERSVDAYFRNVYLTDKKGVIISHQMGTGKTILTISLIELEVIEYMRLNPQNYSEHPLKVVIVIPEGILGSWLEDFRKKCHISNNMNDHNQLRVSVLDPTQLCRNNVDCLCRLHINAPALSYHMNKQTEYGGQPVVLEYNLEIYGYYQFSKIINTPETTNNFDDSIIILDEAHRLETERLRISKFIGTLETKIPRLFADNIRPRDISNFRDVNEVLLEYTNVYNAIRRGKRVIAITGTPIYHSLYDLIFLINLVESEDNLLSFSKKDFNDKYGYRTFGNIINTAISDLHLCAIGQVAWTFAIMRSKDAVGISTLTKQILGPLLSNVISGNPIDITAKVALWTAGFFFIEQIHKKKLVDKRRMMKTYKEELYLIEDDEEMYDLIKRNFLYYNLDDDKSQKQSFAELLEHDITEGCEYSSTQLVFFILSKYGVPLSTFLNLHEFKMQSERIVGPQLDNRNIQFDQNTIFVNEKANTIRENSNSLDEKCMNLAIGNLYFSVKIFKWAEYLISYNKVKDGATIEEQEESLRLKSEIDRAIIQIKDDERTFQNIEWPGKFHSIIRCLQEAVRNGEKSMIYSSFTELGTNLFRDFYNANCHIYGLTIDTIGYLTDPSVPNRNNEIINRFNRYHNNNMKIIVFHPDIMEGVSLKDCMHVHIMEYISLKSKYDQVVARARRLDSHLNTRIYKNIKTPKINVYRYICNSISSAKQAARSWIPPKYGNLSKLMYDSYHLFDAVDDANITVTSDNNAKQKFECLKNNDDIFKNLLKYYSMDTSVSEDLVEKREFWRRLHQFEPVNLSL